MGIKYYDIGVNIFSKQFKLTPLGIVDNCRGNKEIGLVIISNNMAESYKTYEFLQLTNHFIKPYPYIYGTVGIHPHNADKAKKEDFNTLKEYINNVPQIVAIGECGLDYDRNFSTRENQIRCFEKQICLAEELNLPLYLHERKAVNDFIKRFKNHKDICNKSVVHCFTGNRDTLEKYIDMGFYIGITGWISDNKRAKELREAVKILPLDRVMIETDSPFLTPIYKGLSKGINYPWNVKYVAEDLAKYMSVSVEELIKATKDNTEKFFNIKGE